MNGWKMYSLLKKISFLRDMLVFAGCSWWFQWFLLVIQKKTPQTKLKGETIPEVDQILRKKTTSDGSGA